MRLWKVLVLYEVKESYSVSARTVEPALEWKMVSFFQLEIGDWF